MSDIECREPIRLAVGDTLSFERVLPDFPAGQGWSLLYEILGGAAGDAPIQFASQPDGDNHQVTVDEGTTALWLPGDWVLSGYAINGAERHRIYYGQLKLEVGAESPAQPVTTHYQRMVTVLEATLEANAANMLKETDVERTRVLKEQRMDIEKQLAWNRHMRMEEIKEQNVRNGRPSGDTPVPVANIVPGFTRFNPIIR